MADDKPIKIDIDVITSPRSPAGTTDFIYMPTTFNVTRGVDVTFKLVNKAAGGTFKIIFIGQSPFDDDVSSANPKARATGKRGVYYYVAQITMKVAGKRKTYKDKARHCPTIIVQ